MTGLHTEQRVSIAGTVTNEVSGEIIPGAKVRLIQSPIAFIADLMGLIERTIASNPRLMAHYSHLFEDRPITPDTLKTAQVILDGLPRSQQFDGYRPDETLTGGDGHYCFLNLPSGYYTVTAAVSTLDHHYGISRRSVQVKDGANALVFSQLDIEIALNNPQAPLPVCPIPVEQTRAPSTAELGLSLAR